MNNTLSILLSLYSHHSNELFSLCQNAENEITCISHCSSSLVVVLYLSQTAVSHRYCRPYYMFEVILIHFTSPDVFHPIPIRISVSVSDRYPPQPINQSFFTKTKQSAVCYDIIIVWRQFCAAGNGGFIAGQLQKKQRSQPSGRFST